MKKNKIDAITSSTTGTIRVRASAETNAISTFLALPQKRYRASDISPAPTHFYGDETSLMLPSQYPYSPIISSPPPASVSS